MWTFYFTKVIDNLKDSQKDHKENKHKKKCHFTHLSQTDKPNPNILLG